MIYHQSKAVIHRDNSDILQKYLDNGLRILRNTGAYNGNVVYHLNNCTIVVYEGLWDPQKIELNIFGEKANLEKIIAEIKSAIPATNLVVEPAKSE